MKLSEISNQPEYFDRYMNKCDDVELLQAIRTSIEETKNFPIEKWVALGDKVYAPGKWTVKDMLQHLIDTERIFMFRALAFARGEQQRMISYDEDAYALHANAEQRELSNLIEELLHTHESLLKLYESFSEEILLKRGKGFKGEYSVADIGFLLAGHQRWHLQVLEERYYPLLNS